HERGGPTRALAESPQTTRVEDEHPSSGTCNRVFPNAPRNRARSGTLASGRLSGLDDQLGDVPVCLLVQLLAAQLGFDRLLQQLARRAPTPLHSAVGLVGQVALPPRHTPNYTPYLVVPARSDEPLVQRTRPCALSSPHATPFEFPLSAVVAPLLVARGVRL